LSFDDSILLCFGYKRAENQLILEIPLLVGMVILAVSMTEFGEGDDIIVVVVFIVV
jgi:uncharacterized protein (UPF0333 family)